MENNEMCQSCRKRVEKLSILGAVCQTKARTQSVFCLLLSMCIFRTDKTVLVYLHINICIYTMNIVVGGFNLIPISYHYQCVSNSVQFGSLCHQVVVLIKLRLINVK